MSDFAEAQHPRSTDGTFAEKPQSPAEVELVPLAPAEVQLVLEGAVEPVADPEGTRFVVTDAHGREVDRFDPVYSVRTTDTHWHIEGVSYTYDVERAPGFTGALEPMHDDEQVST